VSEAPKAQVRQLEPFQLSRHTKHLPRLSWTEHWVMTGTVSSSSVSQSGDAEEEEVVEEEEEGKRSRRVTFNLEANQVFVVDRYIENSEDSPGHSLNLDGSVDTHWPDWQDEDEGIEF